MKRQREDSTGPQQKRVAPAVPKQELGLAATYEPPQPNQRLTTDDALAYLKAVKDKFKDDKKKYDEFLEVMKDFKAQRIDTAGVITRVKDLFRGHRNLILGFNTFLPKGYEITLPPEEEVPTKKPVEFDQAINYVNKIKTRFAKHDYVYKAFLEILNLYRKGNKSITEVYDEVSLIFKDHKDLLEEFTYFLPDTAQTGAPYAGGGGVAPRGPAPLPRKGGPAPALVPRVMPGKKAAFGTPAERRIDFRGKDDERGRPEGRDKDRKEDDLAQNRRDKRKSPRTATASLQKELAFFDRVKNRLRSRESYQEFLKCLNLFSQEIISRTELHGLVSDILGKYPDLMEGFNDFLSRCESLEFPMDEQTRRPAPPPPPGMAVPPSQAPLPQTCAQAAKLGPAFAAVKEKKWLPISEIDFSQSERCTPSYRLLPKSYPKPIASNRSELCKQVLNDNWVSVTSGSEDYSFKHMRKNQYEEALFRCEDDRYELDMLLLSTMSTAKKVEELVQKLSNMTPEERDMFKVDEQMSAVNLRCMERIYGDHGLDILELLRKSPVVALPVILARLNQKQEEWVKCRAEMNKVWGDVYAKNYHKSLDHRSFYFKQTDKRLISSKGLLADIKEINERKRREDDNMLAMSAGNRRPLIPDITFEYADPTLHEEIHGIVQFAADEMLSPEQSDKVMRFWSSFLEPFFNVRRPKLPMEAGNHTAGKQASGESNEEQSGSQSGGSSGAGSDKTAEGDAGLEAAAAGGAKADDGAASGQDGPVQCGTEAAAAKPQKESKDGDAQSPKSQDAEKTKEDGVKEGLGAALGPAEAPATGVEAPASAPSTAAPDENDGGGAGGTGSGSGGEEGAKDKDASELSPLAERRRRGLRDHGRGKNEAKDRAADGEADGEPDGDAENDGDEEAEEDAGAPQRRRSPEESQDESEEDREHSDGEAEEDEDDDADHEPERDGGGDGEDEGEGAGAPQDRYLACKVLAARPLGGEVPADGNDTHLFYANDTYLVLFRLHQILYERVLSAKQNAKSAEKRWSELRGSPPPDLFKQFVQVLFNLLVQDIDNTKYEDECRAMLGTSSYLLFTLDKLIAKLVKQLQLAATDEMAGKVLALYHYENSRASGLLDCVYHANACVLLHEEGCYRVECALPTGLLTLQVMDSGPDKLDLPAGTMPPSFADYLKYFLNTIPENGEQRVFMTRNAKKYAQEGNVTGGAVALALKDVDIVNGLECKVACSTSKVSYVLDTEDFFHRHRQRARTVENHTLWRSKQEQRLHRLHSWMEKRVSGAVEAAA